MSVLQKSEASKRLWCWESVSLVLEFSNLFDNESSLPFNWLTGLSYLQITFFKNTD